MYKKFITAGLLTLSSAAMAQPYVGIGYQAGVGRVEQNSLRNPVVDGRTLDQSDRESANSARVLAGLQLNDSWGVELAFQRFTLETSVEERVAGTGDDDEWESSVKSSHISLAPVYTHALGEKLGLRVTAGVLYGDYDFVRTHTLDVDNGPDQNLFRAKNSESEFGGVAGIGLAYQTPWKVQVLAEALHQQTKLISNSTLSLTAVYQF
jgi:opacity protein-like surface antigen